jgi:hypothetical protein
VHLEIELEERFTRIEKGLRYFPEEFLAFVKFPFHQGGISHQQGTQFSV